MSLLILRQAVELLTRENRIRNLNSNTGLSRQVLDQNLGASTEVMENFLDSRNNGTQRMFNFVGPVLRTPNHPLERTVNDEVPSLKECISSLMGLDLKVTRLLKERPLNLEELEELQTTNERFMEYSMHVGDFVLEVGKSILTGEIPEPVSPIQEELHDVVMSDKGISRWSPEMLKQVKEDTAYALLRIAKKQFALAKAHQLLEAASAIASSTGTA